MTSKKLLLAGLVAALGLAGSVQAATVHITPSVIGVFNEDFSEAAVIPGTTTLNPKPGGFYLIGVGVTARTEGLGGSAVGFSNTAFNSAITGNGSLYSDASVGFPAWTPDNPPVDTNGPSIPGGVFAKWDINSDDGTANDLQGVILAGVTKGFGPAQFDTRRTLTQGEGDYGGTFYVRLPGEAGSTAGAELIAAFGASTYDAEGVSSTAGNTAVGGSIPTYSVVPEPSTLALLGLGSVLLAFARKRR